MSRPAGRATKHELLNTSIPLVKTGDPNKTVIPAGLQQAGESRNPLPSCRRGGDFGFWRAAFNLLGGLFSTRLTSTTVIHAGVAINDGEETQPGSLHSMSFHPGVISAQSASTLSLAL